MTNSENIVDETTCWYDPDLHVKVNNCIVGLMGLAHGRVLQGLFSLIPLSEKTILDIGCGSALVHSIVGNRDYTGLDLPNNIDTIGKVNCPNLPFIKCDVITDSVPFISEYDIILMNGFIDVMQYPLLMLDKILRYCKGYVVLHRQEIIDTPTKVVANPSYTGFTYHSLINRDDFNLILFKYGIVIVKEVDAGFGGNWRSFLLKNEKYK